MGLSKRDFNNVLTKLNIKKGDTVLVNSNILKIIIKKKNKLNVADLIDILKKKVTKKGTLIFPTYSWDFCKYKQFDYSKTKSVCGSLSNYSLLDKDFIRSRNPIFSFSIYGKNKQRIASMNHDDCFSMKSPFGYLIKNKGKNLFIDIDHKEANTFVHIAEQLHKVSYRYSKTFSGIYINKFKKKKKVKVKMYVRKNYVTSTVIKKKSDKIFKEKKLLNNLSFKKINFSVLNIGDSFKLFCNQIKNKDSLISYTK